MCVYAYMYIYIYIPLDLRSQPPPRPDHGEDQVYTNYISILCMCTHNISTRIHLTNTNAGPLNTHTHNNSLVATLLALLPSSLLLLRRFTPTPTPTTTAKESKSTGQGNQQGNQQQQGEGEGEGGGDASFLFLAYQRFLLGLVNGALAFFLFSFQGEKHLCVYVSFCYICLCAYLC